MADEITERVSVSVVSANGFRGQVNWNNKQTQNGSGQVDKRVISVGTSESDLTFQNITNPGVFVLTNLDATNFVKYGPKDTTMTEFGRLLPGETHKIRIPTSGVTLRWVADTSAVNVQIEVQED